MGQEGVRERKRLVRRTFTMKPRYKSSTGESRSPWGHQMESPSGFFYFALLSASPLHSLLVISLSFDVPLSLVLRIDSMTHRLIMLLWRRSWLYRQQSEKISITRTQTKQRWRGGILLSKLRRKAAVLRQSKFYMDRLFANVVASSSYWFCQMRDEQSLLPDYIVQGDGYSCCWTRGQITR